MRKIIIAAVVAAFLAPMGSAVAHEGCDARGRSGDGEITSVPGPLGPISVDADGEEGGPSGYITVFASEYEGDYVEVSGSPDGISAHGSYTGDGSDSTDNADGYVDVSSDGVDACLDVAGENIV